MKKKRINIVTLGCSKNIVDSEYLSGHLLNANYTLSFDSPLDNAEIIIINTCGFIGDAKEESIDTILRFAEAKKKGEIEKLIVCGCLSQRYKEELQNEIPDVDAFFGVHEWLDIIKYLDSNASSLTYKKRKISTPSHYAYLKIAEGCNRSCSYCAIPLIRGEHISKPLEELLAEAGQLADNGVKELLLIAQDTTFYGLDIYGKRRLGDLLKGLTTIKKLEWIRLHYTFPTNFPVDLIEVIRDYPTICKYIDIPFQHISTNVLKSMKRGIDKQQTYELIQKFREEIPAIALRSTLIVGYPNETEKEFEELKEFVRQVRFDRLGVFQYSPEEGTPAFTLGDPVPDETKQFRADELMNIQQQISWEINQAKIGKTFKTIIDRKENEFWIGRTEFDSPEIDNEVLIPSHQNDLKIGSFYHTEIQQAEEYDLYGVINNLL